MHSNNRGFALVTVLLITVVMMMISSLLGHKVIQSTRSSAQQGIKKKSYYAANAGVEEARRLLATGYDSTTLWADILTVADAGEYPILPSFSLRVDSLPVRVFVRDNNDGDGDYTRDNDLRVFVLAEATGIGNTETMVEALCFLKPGGGGGYEGQYGQGAAKNNRSSGGIEDVVTSTAAEYDIGDAE